MSMSKNHSDVQVDMSIQSSKKPYAFHTAGSVLNRAKNNPNCVAEGKYVYVKNPQADFMNYDSNSFQRFETFSSPSNKMDSI